MFPIIVLSLVGRVVGWWRLRRTPVELAGVDATAPMASTDAHADQEDVRALPLAALSLRVAEAEGWFEEAPSAPPNPTRERLRGPLGIILGTMGLPLLAVGIVTWNPRLLLLFGVPGLLLIGYVLVTLAAAARADAAARLSPEMSGWPYLAVRTLTDDWQVLLLRDGEPVWVLALAASRHPDVAGTCLARGPLEEGRRIALEIDGATWCPPARSRR